MSVTLTIDGSAYLFPEYLDENWGDYSTEAIQALALKSLYPSDIINDVTTGGTDVPLSAEQGKTLKGLIDTNTTNIGTKADKITSPTNDNIVTMDATGNIKDSGYSIDTIPSSTVSEEKFNNLVTTLEQQGINVSPALDDSIIAESFASPIPTGTAAITTISDQGSNIYRLTAAAGAWDTTCPNWRTLTGQEIIVYEDIEAGEYDFFLVKGYDEDDGGNDWVSVYSTTDITGWDDNTAKFRINSSGSVFNISCDSIRFFSCEAIDSNAVVKALPSGAYTPILAIRAKATGPNSTINRGQILLREASALAVELGLDLGELMRESVAR
jgi:hypothetical protein